MEHQREIAITLPPRTDGLFERACPHCQARFAIHSEDYETGGYLNLRCPRCEWVDEKDEFTTPEQRAYVRAAGENAAREMAEELVADQLKDMFRGLRGTPGIRVTGSAKRPQLGRQALPEPNANVPLTPVKCPSCGFRYATDASVGGVCPVCR